MTWLCGLKAPDGKPSALAKDHLGRRSGFFIHYNKHPWAALTCENEWVSRNPVPRLLGLAVRQLTPLAGCELTSEKKGFDACGERSAHQAHQPTLLLQTESVVVVLIEFIRVVLVNKTIQISRVQLKTSPAYWKVGWAGGSGQTGSVLCAFWKVPWQFRRFGEAAWGVCEARVGG